MSSQSFFPSLEIDAQLISDDRKVADSGFVQTGMGASLESREEEVYVSKSEQDCLSDSLASEPPKRKRDRRAAKKKEAPGTGKRAEWGDRPKRFTLLREEDGERVLTDAEVLKTEVSVGELESLESEDAALRWATRMGLVANEMRCSRLVREEGSEGAGRECLGPMTLWRARQAKTRSQATQLQQELGLSIPGRKRPKPQDDSHGKYVDGYDWHCIPCARNGRKSARAIRSASIFSSCHYGLLEILPQLAAFALGLHNDATAASRVGSPATGTSQRRWVRTLTQLAFDWCLQHVPNRITAKVAESPVPPDRIDFLPIFRDATAPRTLQTLIILIRDSQRAKAPILFPRPPSPTLDHSASTSQLFRD